MGFQWDLGWLGFEGGFFMGLNWMTEFNGVHLDLLMGVHEFSWE